MSRLIIILMILLPLGCSMYEFKDPTGAEVRIQYAKTSKKQPSISKSKTYEEKKEATVASNSLPPTALSSNIGEHWALVIGISKYQDSRIPRLRYAQRDANFFYQWFTSPKGGRHAPSRVKLLVNEEATCKNIKEALFVWLKQALEEDVVTIYYAGHGSPDSPDSRDNLYLLPYDTDYKNISSTAFPMWDVETAIKRFIKAKKVVIVTDACHSGGVGHSFDVARRSNRGLKINPINTGIQQLSTVGNGVAVISASDANQYSQEGEQWGGGHGVFTYYLVKGLEGEADYDGNKQVSLGELVPYLSENVRRATANSQCPTIAGKFDPALSIGSSY